MPAASINDTWVDIVPPDVPAHTADLFTLGFAVAGVFALFVVGGYWYRRPRLRAKRALRSLTRELPHPQLNTKLVCVQILQSLRQGLGQHRLLAIQWRGDHHSAWLAYVQCLSRGCFAASSPTKAELDRLIREGLIWLNRKAVEP